MPLDNPPVPEEVKETLHLSPNHSLALWNLPSSRTEKLGWGIVERKRFHYSTKSLIYFCPQCGRKWGEVRVLQPNGNPAHYLARPRFCPSHGKGYLIPGEEEYEILLPRWVSEREILLLSKYQESNYSLSLITGAKYEP